MAWKRRSTSTTTSVDVDLHEFDPAQLLQGLIDYHVIDEAEAERILNRKGASFSGTDTGVRDALDDFRVGRRLEGLITLERALGRDWAGILSKAAS